MAMVETTGKDNRLIGNFTLTDIVEVDVITETGIVPSVKFKIKFKSC